MRSENQEIGKASELAAFRVSPESNPGGPGIRILLGIPPVDLRGFAALRRVRVPPLENKPVKITSDHVKAQKQPTLFLTPAALAWERMLVASPVASASISSSS